jgi:hypothetical protein
VLVIEAIHQLFPWLRHLFADSVYNGPNLNAALTKFATGPSRSLNARLRRPAFNCCRVAGSSSEPSPGSIATAGWQRISRHRSRALGRGFTSPRCSSSSGDWPDPCTMFLRYNTTITIQIQTLSAVIRLSTSPCRPMGADDRRAIRAELSRSGEAGEKTSCDQADAQLSRWQSGEVRSPLPRRPANRSLTAPTI